MAKKNTETKPAEKKNSKTIKPKKSVEDISVTKAANEIVITETEDDIILDSGFNGDPDNLKNEIKKEAAKSDVLYRFLVPLFTFIVIGLIAGGLTWYYSRPSVTTIKTKEEKIENAPEVKETTPAPAATTTTPAPAASTPAPAAPTTKTYTVQSGDTLSSIANANGLTSKQLADYNGITSPDSLTIGQVLKIPTQ